VRTTIRLDDQLLEQAKQYALTHGITFTAVVEDALRKKLISRHAVKKQARIKLKTVSGKGVNAGIDLDESASLLDVSCRSIQP
jgi:hypothetical protein